MNVENSKSMAMILVAFILAVGLVTSTMIATTGFVDVKGSNTVTVTGSAKKQIKSDLIVWKANFSTQRATITEAYAKLNGDRELVKKYLVDQGIKESDIVISAIMTQNITELLPNGMYSNNVIAYRLDQTIEVSGTDVDGLTKISREATELINQGVEFSSWAPQYYYTKIADLKVDMLAEATKDAKNRAEQIALSTGATIGDLKTAKMGVFQITPLYSTEVADYGINDTSSMEKEITAVVTCGFKLK